MPKVGKTQKGVMVQVWRVYCANPHCNGLKHITAPEQEEAKTKLAGAGWTIAAVGWICAECSGRIVDGVTDRAEFEQLELPVLMRHRRITQESMAAAKINNEAVRLSGLIKRLGVLNSLINDRQLAESKAFLIDNS